MNRTALTLVAAAFGLAACGGTPPFGGQTTDTGGDPDTGEGAVPAVLAGSVQSFTYDPGSQRLSVVGVPFDDGPFTGQYRRRPGLDQAGYEAYTAQDGSLDRHTTAYVREINGTQAAVIVTGVQFEQVFGGVAYSNDGGYVPPVEPGSDDDGGLVSYAGGYVGLINGGGSSEDLAPVAGGGQQGQELSAQAAEVRGSVLITADFADAQVAGIVYDRVVVDFDNVTPGVFPNAANPLQVEDIALDSTSIAADGTFAGTASVGNQSVGDFGGIFGGDGATEVAGGIAVADHISVFNNEIEWGTFVLAACGQAQEDPLCNQPIR